MISYNVIKVRKDFPILENKKNNHPLIYLDHASSSQMPQPIAKFIYNYQINKYATVHRGSYSLSEGVSLDYEKSRKKIALFIGAKYSQEVIFNSGTSYGLNFLANSLSKYINKGDEILISEMEHHSNYIPWFLLCKKKQAILKRITINKDGEIDLDDFRKKLNKKTKILSIIHASNVLGTINPIQKIIEEAKQFNTIIIIDGAQAIAHIPVNVQKLNCDFYVFSGHKIYGPNGTGILYGKKESLELLDPFMQGGGTIEEINVDENILTCRPIPFQFELGTPAIIPNIALGETIEYIENINMDSIQKYETHLLNLFESELKKIKKIKIFGNAKEKIPIISFQLKSIHPHDLGTIFDEFFICIRSGQHCAQPLMRHYNSLEGSNRISLGIYNEEKEIEKVLYVIKKAINIFNI